MFSLEAVKKQLIHIITLFYLLAAGPWAFAYPTPVGEWDFEEDDWSTYGAVKDSQGNYNGTAYNGAYPSSSTPARSGSPGTCQYGVFPNTNSYIDLGTVGQTVYSGMTASAWVRFLGSPQDSNDSAKILTQDDVFWFGFNEEESYWCGPWYCVMCDTCYDPMRNEYFGVMYDLRASFLDTVSRHFPSNSTTSADTWHHFAITYTYDDEISRVYVNGVLREEWDISTIFISNLGTLYTGDERMSIGYDADDGTSGFKGYIDQVKLFDQELSAADILEIYNETNSCPGFPADHFIINHDRVGNYCVDEPITVTAYDNSNNVFKMYDGSVYLDTQNGHGNWSLASGNGSFINDGNGVARYTFSTSDNGVAQFRLNYTQSGPPSVDIDVYEQSDSTNRDTDSENSIEYYAQGFVWHTDPNNVSSGMEAQDAGDDVTAYLSAYGVSPTDGSCGILTGYHGNLDVYLWQNRVNPVSGTENVTVSNTPLPLNSPGTDFLLTFTLGTAPVSNIKYNDVGQLRLFANEGSTYGSGDIVFKPYDLVVTTVEGVSPVVANPQAADENGDRFIRAGEPFKVVVESRAKPDPSSPNTPIITPNFGKETPAEGLILAAPSANMLPSGGNNPGIENPTSFGDTSPAGTMTGSQFAWQEVGIIQLQASIADGDYLGGGNVTGSLSDNVGRFYPNDFFIESNLPSFSEGCSTGFTYLDQPFDFSTNPVFTITARSLDGSTTENYTNGGWQKMSLTHLKDTLNAGTFNHFSLVGTPATSMILESTLDDNTVTLAQAATPVAGQLLLTYPSTLADGRFKITRTTADNIPGFTADISLNVTISDPDAVTATWDALTDHNPIPFVNGNQFHHGRLEFPAHNTGEEFANVEAHTMIYDDTTTGWIINNNDSCTQIKETDVLCSQVPGSDLATPLTVDVLNAGGIFTNGVGTIQVAGSGVKGGGSVNLMIYLRETMPGSPPSSGCTLTDLTPTGTTTADLPWLRYDYSKKRDVASPHDEEHSIDIPFNTRKTNNAHFLIRDSAQ